MNAKSGLSLTLSLALAPWGAAAERWSLEFGNDTPQQLVLEDAKGKLQFYWYLLYWVKNPGTKPVRPQLNLTMKLTLGKDEKTYADGYNTQAELYLEKKVFRRKVCNWAEVRAKPLEPNEKREGVALFHLGTEMPDFDLMEIMVRGLAEPRFVGREGNVRKFRRSTLLLTYRYVPSRWRAGKELKYVPERWILEDVEVADRTLTEGQASDDVSKRLRELLKKAEEARKKKPTSRAKPPPTEGDASKSRQELIAIRYSPGSPAPQLLAALRELMTRPPAIRATFRETVGRGPRAQHASGTIIVERSGRFTMERLPRLAGRSTIKELRVFDGRSLWVQSSARGVGEAVRRWDSAKCRKEWFTIDGRPEVDFASVVNPARAWCLFFRALVYLGAERLPSESTYVLEARPGKEFERVLRGPLAPEVVGMALGRRVRFWLGESTGFLRKMEVYDRDGAVIARLECPEVHTDAVVEPSLFVFKPPKGVEVIEMSAGLAETSAP